MCVLLGPLSPLGSCLVAPVTPDGSRAESCWWSSLYAVNHLQKRINSFPGSCSRNHHKALQIILGVLLIFIWHCWPALAVHPPSLWRMWICLALSLTSFSPRFISWPSDLNLFFHIHVFPQLSESCCHLKGTKRLLYSYKTVEVVCTESVCPGSQIPVKVSLGLDVFFMLFWAKPVPDLQLAGLLKAMLSGNELVTHCLKLDRVSLKWLGV